MADSAIQFTIDIDEFTANLSVLEKLYDAGKAKASLDVAYEIIRLSSLEVPHDKGSLQNSATVQEVNGNIVLGYHEPYAARLHEHPEYTFQKGRKGKYLSDPIIRNAAVLGIRLAKGIDDVVKN